MRTAESVTPKHPDKMCDQISDAILDYCLSVDPMARVAIETMGGHGMVHVMGELTMSDTTELHWNVTRIVKEIAGEHIQLLTTMEAQSREISQGVDDGGAGDQGIMVGYATNENEAMIPQEAHLARWLAMFLFDRYPYDGKTQITIDETTKDVTAIVASFQNVPGTELKEAIYEWIEKNNIQCRENPVVHANPAGDWNQGGFDADTGLTGRKIAVDCYGPQIPIGGGAFSGKDATKVDRSAAYMARRIAVDMLREYEADEVFVKLAYAIGVKEPVMADVVMKGNKKPFDPSTEKYDLTPDGIINYLHLREPKFRETALWGHFGNEFEWDK